MVVVTLSLMVVIALCPGCSSKAREARSLARAERLFQEEDYEAAVVEYTKVLRLNSSHQVAIRKLAITYLELRNYARAFPLLVKAVENEPANTKLRLELGTLCLAGGRPHQARTEAAAVLDHQPTNFPALLLLADASRGTNDCTEALNRLEAVRGPHDVRPLFHVAVGNIHLRLGNDDAAGKAYRQALSRDENSVQAHMALGKLSMRKGDRETAAREFETAVRLAPRDLNARISFAAFKLDSGDPNTAKALLAEVLSKMPDHPNAAYQMARVHFAQKDYDACVERLNAILRKQPKHMQAILLKANARFAEGQPEEVIRSHEKLIIEQPNSADLHAQLAIAFIRTRDVRRAIQALEVAVSQPSYPIQSALLLAELRIRTGDYALAIDLLKKTLARDTNQPKAHLLLGLAHHAKDDLQEAAACLRTARQLSPDDPQPPYLLGRVLRDAGEPEEAREAFRAALDIAPGAVAALTALVAEDMQAKRFDAAAGTVKAQIALAPEQPAYLDMLAQIHIAAKDVESAEKQLLKSIDMEHQRLSPYLLLCQVYAAQGKQEDALRKVEESLAVHPKAPTSLMLAAVLHQRQENAIRAAELYERLLDVRPDFGGAANNLAYLYSEKLGRLEEAHKLAQRARELAPKDPHVADTFGWILHRRGEYKWALAVLRESAAQLSDQPEVQYHAGMTCYALGDESAARACFEKALAIRSTFPGAGQVKDLLEILRIDPATASRADALGRLQKTLDEDPNHVAALTRTAAIWVHHGDSGKAKQYYEKALAANPSYVPALAGSAVLCLEHSGDLNRAQELARKAKDLAPFDAQVALVAGRIAYASGDYVSALNLLRESAQAITDSSDVSYYLGMANYMQGRVHVATQELSRALSAGLDSARADDARLLLQTVRLTADAKVLSALPAPVEEKLKQEPKYIPGLMLLARIKELGGNSTEARTLYEDIVELNASFGPAVSQLAVLYTAGDGQGEDHYEFLREARELLPRDPDVALALGKVVYARKEYDWARRLLQEGARAMPDNPEPLYFIGMCLYRAGDKAEAARALGRFVDMCPDSPRTAQARQILDGLK